MKLFIVLGILSAALRSTASASNESHPASASTRFACTEQLFCDEEYHRLYWQSKKQSAQLIVESRDLISRNTFVLKSSVDELKREKRRLCSDFHVGGFLMQNGSNDWPIACLWAGSDLKGTCAPAPAISGTFDYVDAAEWQSRLTDFRRLLDCPKQDIEAAKTAKELFICRERCIQAGLGYITQIVMTFSLTGLAGVLLTRGE